MAGHEAMLMLTASPFLLAIPSFRRLAGAHFHKFQLVSFATFASFPYNDVFHRLKLLALSVPFNTLAQAAEWERLKNYPELLERRLRQESDRQYTLTSADSEEQRPFGWSTRNTGCQDRQFQLEPALAIHERREWWL